MKRFFFILLLLFTGCRLLDFPLQSLVRLQNDTNFDVKIITYGDFGFDPKSLYYVRNGVFDSLNISKGKFIEKVLQPNQSFNPFLTLGSDSVVIIFDSKKILKQSCNGKILAELYQDKCNIINNLLKSSNGTIEKINRGKYGERRVFKITQSDYDRAVDIVK